MTNMESEKKCNICGGVFLLSEFYTYQRGGEGPLRIYGNCKKCVRLQSQKQFRKKRTLINGIYYGPYAILDVDKINREMKKKGLTFKSMSFHLKIHDFSFKVWMEGKVRPHMKRILALSSILECPPEELIFNKPIED